jgi:hypothetical protein
MEDRTPRKRRKGRAGGMTTHDVLTPDRADLLGLLDDAMWSSPLDGPPGT